MQRRRTDLDGHTGDVKTMREQDALAQHALVSCGKLDLGDGKGMTEMQTSVHVWVGKVAEPFGVLLVDFGGGESSDVCWGRCVDFKDVFVAPASLVFLFQRL